MGILETQVKKEIRKTKIQKAILTSIALAGVLSVSMLAPNALQMLKLFGLDKKLMRDKRHSINLSRDRLIKNGLVKYNSNHFLYLTEKGMRVYKEIEMKNFKIKKPKRWDQKWRILIFDIKEYKRQLRNKVRTTLIAIGFVKLQNSVWVYPYDCEDLINLMKTDFMIGKEMLYIIADRIENEAPIKKRFGLR